MTNMEFRSENLKNYESFVNSVIKELPTVHHYSWFDIKRKIYTYKNYWSKHWTSLFNKETSDIPENNMFFDKKWSEVSDKEIENLAVKMDNELGGWIFHSKLNFNSPTPWLTIDKEHPTVMKNWLQSRGEL